MCSVLKRLIEKTACLGTLAERLIRCGGLELHMKRDQCIVHRLADSKLPLAAAYDLRVCALGEQYLISIISIIGFPGARMLIDESLCAEKPPGCALFCQAARDSRRLPRQEY